MENLPHQSWLIGLSFSGMIAKLILGLLLLVFFSRMPRYGTHRDLIRTWVMAWAAYTISSIPGAIDAFASLLSVRLLSDAAYIWLIWLAAPARWLFLVLVVVAALQASGRRISASLTRRIAVLVPLVGLGITLTTGSDTILAIELLAVPVTMLVAAQLVALSAKGERRKGLVTLSVAMSLFALALIPELLAQTTMNLSWLAPATERLLILVSPRLEVFSLMILAAGVILLVLQDSVLLVAAEREAFERRAAETEKMVAVGRVMSGIAHELNNPLSVVLGWSEQLAEEAATQEMRNGLDAIHAHAIRARHIVRDLLTFVRDPKEITEATDLGELIGKVVEYQQEVASSRSIVLHKEVAGPVSVHGSRVALEQVLVNLVGNAIDAVDANGDVWIKASASADGAELVVEDSGPGIDEELHSRIFEPFFTTKPIGEGTGLGLALARGIIAHHGGKLSFENRPRPGIGVRMVATLLPPRPDDTVLEMGSLPGKKMEPTDAGWQEAGRLGGALVVDDEPAVRATISRILASWGWQVQEAGSADDGLAILRGLTADQAPALILCDMKMPGKSGAQMHNDLQSTHPELVHRMVFVTGNSSDSETAKFLAETGRQVIEKPFTIDEMAAAVERTLTPA